MQVDNIHYNLNRILSHNKKFNLVISAREAGKSTATWLYAYKQFKSGHTTIVLRRLINDITSTYIEDIENIINKFSEEPIKLKFAKGNIKEGIVQVEIDDKPFFRVIALSNPLSRIKSLMFPNLRLIIFDEFICNTRLKEKYLDNEVFKFKELFNTFQRECDDGKLRVIFLGNPYSLYNPYFSWLNVNKQKLYPGSFIVGPEYCVEVYELTEELKAHILEKNPLYKFDDSYTKYAFDGRAINDEQIQILEKQPQGFQLRYVFYNQGKKLGIYRNTNTASIFEDDWFFYWIGVLDNYDSKRRDVQCFDLNDLIEGNVLISNDDKKRFQSIKAAFRNRHIKFKSVEESYLFEEIYQLI